MAQAILCPAFCGDSGMSGVRPAAGAQRERRRISVVGLGGSKEAYSGFCKDEFSSAGASGPPSAGAAPNFSAPVSRAAQPGQLRAAAACSTCQRCWQTRGSAVQACLRTQPPATAAETAAAAAGRGKVHRSGLLAPGSMCPIRVTTSVGTDSRAAAAAGQDGLSSVL